MFVPGSGSGSGWGQAEDRAPSSDHSLASAPAPPRPTLNSVQKVRPSGHLGETWDWQPACGQVGSVITRSDGEIKWSLDKIKDKVIQNKYKKDPKWSDLNSMTENKWTEKCLRKQYQFYKLSGLS